ncbi:MAG: sigma-70 family RNA polymerase sigma factor [Microthrixaceae bacterium]
MTSPNSGAESVGDDRNVTDTAGTDRALPRSMEPEATFEAMRPTLTGLAYRLLGSWSEAEDVVGDVAERWLRADGTTIENPEAWLTTVTTRRALDVLRSARVTRVEYPGEWLPEPIATDGLPAEYVEQRESLRLGFLTMLERLTPIERAVLVLYDVMGWDHAAIAEALEREPAAVRQALHRARKHVGDDERTHDATRVDHDTVQSLLDRALVALAEGDEIGVAGLLSPDVVLIGDGGGVVTSAMRPVTGSERVGRFLLVLASRQSDFEVRSIEINGVPGYALHFDGIWSLITIDTDGDRITRVYSVRNPAKTSTAVGQAGLVQAPDCL